jgi:heme/copper-type cytochrome/quinol oxidase subunit 3
MHKNINCSICYFMLSCIPYALFFFFFAAVRLFPLTPHHLPGSSEERIKIMWTLPSFLIVIILITIHPEREEETNNRRSSRKSNQKEPLFPALGTVILFLSSYASLLQIMQKRSQSSQLILQSANFPRIAWTRSCIHPLDHVLPALSSVSPNLTTLPNLHTPSSYCHCRQSSHA